jgi:ATP/maltotriose-dependent transcriptional regulator MalT
VTRSSEAGPAAEALVDREHELGRMDAALEQAARGRPALVVIEADAGMGKSTLIDAFLAGCGDDVTARRFACTDSEQDIPFGIAGLILREAVPSTCSGVEIGRRLLAWLSALQEGTAQDVVLVVDDAQWMDRESARALRFVLRRLSADRVLVVIAQRPTPRAGGSAFAVPAGPVPATLVRLGPLDVAAVRDLADRARRWSVPAETAAELTRRTGGVPLLVAAAIRGASDPRQLGSAADAPASLAEVTRRLLHSVGEAAGRLAQAVAVLGEATEIAVLGAITDLADPTTAVETAKAGGLVVLDGQGRVVCAHALLQGSLRDTVPLPDRRELHARAARWTSGDRRLHHRAEAADRPDPALVADLLEGAAQARRAGNHAVSARHRLRARAVCSDPAQRDRLVLEALVDRVEAQDLTGAQELAPAATEAPPSELRSRALGLLDRERGHVAPARTWLRQALQLAIEAAHAEAITRAALAAAVLHVRMGEGRAAVEVLEHATLTDDPELSTDVLTTRAIGLWQTHASAEAARLLENVPIDPDGTPWEAELVATRGMFALSDGRPAESLVDLDTAIRFAHLWRPSTNQTRIHTLRSRARYLLGDWDGAAIDAAAARALAPGNAEAWSAAIAFGASVPVAANRGQFDVARHYMARARDALPDWAPDIITDQVRAHEVVLAQARADHRGVLAALEPTRAHEQWGTSTRVGHELLRARIGALVALGRLGEAEADLHRYETMLDEVPHSPGPRRLHLVRGLLAEARGRPGRARDHYAAELADPELRQNPFLLAQTLHTAGKLGRSLGHRHDAVRCLTQAQDIYAHLEAAPFLERCAADLETCVVVSPAVPTTTLTPRERDVAALVKRGYTNKEVAAELFLTAKTVEFHLRNIYAKLGLTGRQQLRRLDGS